jgi:hypothetical protein
MWPFAGCTLCSSSMLCVQELAEIEGSVWSGVPNLHKKNETWSWVCAPSYATR